MGSVSGGKFVVRFINVGMRAMTLVSKFALIFFLARFLEPSEVGLYGLVSVSISYAVYFLGFDFYIFSTRELLQAKPDRRGSLIKSQFGLSLLLYSIILPLTLVIFILDILPWSLAPWFLCLLVLEHISQELHRLLVCFKKQLAASFVLFLRSGLWALAVVFIMSFIDSARSLESLLFGWLVGGILAAGVGCIVLKSLKMGGWKEVIDWQWIRKGLIVAIPMLISSMAIRGIFTIDRYWYESWVGLEALGAYVLFIGIATALQSFMDAAVFSFSYPDLVSAHAEKKNNIFRDKFRQMTIQSAVLLSLLFLAAWVCLNPLLSWLDKPIYTAYKDVFGWVLVANFLFVAGMIPQYALYAQGFDKPIVFTHLLGLVVFVPVTWLLGVADKSMAVPMGLCITCLVIMISKVVAYYKLTPYYLKL